MTQSDKNINSNEGAKEITVDRVVLTSFLVDVSDVVVSLFIAIITGSVTMISQTLEGASDLFSSSFLLIGNKRSKLPPVKKHPYGFGRETYFWALMSGLVTLSVTSTLSIYLGYKRFMEPETVKNLSYALLALVFSLFSNGYSAILSYKRLLRNKDQRHALKTFLNSPLIEVKTSLVLDLMGTIASILGLIALTIYKLSGNLRFDGLGAIATGVALAVLSFFILIGAKDLLIGRSASIETYEKIKKAVTSFKEVQTIVDLRTLILGSNKLLISMEINVDDNLNTNELEILIDKIEKRIAKKISWKKTDIQIELEASNI
jgi:cation diffusion facilitator family transporter